MWHVIGKWFIDFASDKGTVLSVLVFFINMVIQNICAYLVIFLTWLKIEDAEKWLKFGATAFAFMSAIVLFFYHLIRLYREYHKSGEEE